MDFASLLPERSVDDIVAERIRLVIGGEVYDLPVLSITENRAWKERLDLDLGFLLVSISSTHDLEAVLRLFDAAEVSWLALLKDYDQTGVLPSAEDLESTVTPFGLIKMVLEVWRAARPFAELAGLGALMVDRTTERQTSDSPRPTSTWRRLMDGLLGQSRPA